MKLRIVEAQVPKTFYKEVRGKKVYIVDGNYIRTHLEKEFTNFSQHYEFPDLIPEGEIWLDKEAAPGEKEYFISHAATEYERMGEGSDFDTAHEGGAEKETNLRQKTMQKKEDVRKSLWDKLDESGISIYIVDGEAVRNQHNIDFTEGGHWLVYDFIPKNEIWIDDDIKETERQYIIAHELFELKKMAKGLSYDQAHELASRYERTLRQKS